MDKSLINHRLTIDKPLLDHCLTIDYWFNNQILVGGFNPYEKSWSTNQPSQILREQKINRQPGLYIFIQYTVFTLGSTKDEHGGRASFNSSMVVAWILPTPSWAAGQYPSTLPNIPSNWWIHNIELYGSIGERLQLHFFDIDACIPVYTHLCLHIHIYV